MKQYHSVNYIEIPADRNIRRVAVCPTTNRFAIATKNHIRVWSYDTRRMELMFTVKVEFDIKIIDLYCDYIAFASSSEVRAIKVCIEKQTPGFSSKFSLFSWTQII